MRTKEEIKLGRQYAEVSDIAIQMASDRRILIDFLHTVASSPNSGGTYTHTREMLQAKALKIIEDLGID